MAMSTRWRMPPDSSCGYWPGAVGGSGMPARSRASTAAMAAVRRSARPWIAQHLGDLVADAL